MENDIKETRSSLIEKCKKLGIKGYSTKKVEQLKSLIEENNNNTKKQLGQFYTTNYSKILNGMYIPNDITNIIEPFAGNGDLLSFQNIGNIGNYSLECYDIDPKHPRIIQQDTLLNPLNLNDKFVITNPPYLARNKCTSKILFDKYRTNDV